MLKKIAVAAVVYAMLPLTATLGMAQENSQQKIMDAVMQVYADELKKNPDDFAVLYSRANQYFINGDYQKALDDVNAALEVTTRSDLQMLVDEYVLRAKIYNVTGKLQLALADLQEANKLDPSSEAVLNMLADSYYDNGDWTNARNSYMALYRRSNINYKAILGLARTEVRLNNAGQAMEYANRAVELYPADVAVYVGRAEVLELLGRNQEAAQDLIMALSISDGGGDAIPRLMRLSDVAYDDVVAALDAAISNVPDGGMFYYIKSSVQVGHFRYADGLRALHEIITRKLYDYHSIYYNAAIAAYNLCRFDDALAYIDKAIDMQGELPYYYVLKSQILSAMNRVEDAYNAIKVGLMVKADDLELLYQRAMLDIDAGEYRAAQQGLNEIIMTNASWARARYMRGWLRKNCLGDENAAKNDFTEILLTGDGNDLLRGFALHELGRDDEAAQWCESIVKEEKRSGGEARFVAAVVMSLCGRADDAIAYLDQALAHGYGSYYDVMDNETPLRSLRQVRHLEKFKSTVEAHKSLFE